MTAACDEEMCDTQLNVLKEGYVFDVLMDCQWIHCVAALRPCPAVREHKSGPSLKLQRDPRATFSSCISWVVLSVCLSVCVTVCLYYSREGRRARKRGCPPGARVIIEGGHCPTLRPRGRRSTCLMGGEGVLTLAVRVFILFWITEADREREKERNVWERRGEFHSNIFCKIFS